MCYIAGTLAGTHGRSTAAPAAAGFSTAAAHDAHSAPGTHNPLTRLTLPTTPAGAGSSTAGFPAMYHPSMLTAAYPDLPLPPGLPPLCKYMYT